MVFQLALLLAARTHPAKIDAFIQTDLHDASFTARVVSGDQAALAKIGKDFGTSYKFSSAKVYLKEPFEVRLESEYEGSKVVMIENGLAVSYRVPGIHLKPRDLTHSPGGRQTFLDFGVLTPSLMASLFDAAFVSEDSAAGTATFDLTFKSNPEYQDTTRHRVVFDAARKFVVRREWYGQDGVLKATFTYLKPVQNAGIWLPSDVQVANKDGKMAGETKAEDIKVNTGLDDKLFALR